MVRIYDYYDYHTYLSEEYRARKEADKSFSYRYIQNVVGIDPGFLRKVFKGERELSPKFVEPFIGLLKLNKKESEYFRVMVHYGRAKDPELKDRYLKILLKAHSVNGERIDADRCEFYRKWYYTAIREVLGYIDFTDDYSHLAQKLYPTITAREAEEGIALLKRLEFIAPDENGFYRSTSRFITTGNEWLSSSIREFQRQTLSLAADALESLPKDKRDVSTITLSVSTEGVQQVRNIIANCRKQILEVVQQDTNVSASYNVNFSLFPVSRQEK